LSDNFSIDFILIDIIFCGGSLFKTRMHYSILIFRLFYSFTLQFFNFFKSDFCEKKKKFIFLVLLWLQFARDEGIKIAS